MSTRDEGMGDDELTFSVGAREIYDGVQALTAEVRAMRSDHADEKRARERRDEVVDEQIADIRKRLGILERIGWTARGAFGLGLAAVGWLIEAKVIGK